MGGRDTPRRAASPAGCALAVLAVLASLLLAAASAAGASRGHAGGSGAGRRVSSATAARLLAATPYMGWDTYFAFGGNYSESTVLEQASRRPATRSGSHAARGRD